MRVSIFVSGTPHLGELFKRNGYRTGIIGKHQPIADHFIADDLEQDEYLALLQESSKYYKSLGGGSGERAKGEFKKSFYVPSRYSMPFGPHTMDYDYSFLNQYACCRVGGGYFENGKNTEPFTKFNSTAILLYIHFSTFKVRGSARLSRIWRRKLLLYDNVRDQAMWPPPGKGISRTAALGHSGRRTCIYSKPSAVNARPAVLRLALYRTTPESKSLAVYSNKRKSKESILSLLWPRVFY